MKKLLVWIALITMSTQLSWAQNSLSIESLETIAPECHDYRVFYNLGSLYASENKIGPAILNFKKATLLNPYDKSALENLNYLRGKLGTPAYLFDLTPPEKVLQFPFTIFSINVAFLIGFFCFTIGTILLALLLSGHELPFIKEQHLRTARFIAIGVGIFGIIYASSAYVRYFNTFDRSSAVAVSTVKLLERPESNAAQLAEIPEGTECRVKSTLKGYYLVNTIHGKEGWASETGVKRLWNK